MSAVSDGRFAAGLRSYVRAVARAMEVEPEAAWCEVADPSTAYVAVRERAPDYPEHDVMLLWDERLGWLVALENNPAEQPVTLARVDGDVVPEPALVARTVRAVLGAPSRFSTSPPRAGTLGSGDVRARILAYAAPVLIERVVTIRSPLEPGLDTPPALP
jgi:hypothetical protein